MTNCDPRIEAYMEAVETGKVEASKDVKALMKHIRQAGSNSGNSSSEALTYKVGTVYTLQVELKVRTGAGTGCPTKSYSQLTLDGQRHDKDHDGCLDAGTQVTCQAVKNVGSDIWILVPSGWIAAYYDGDVYVK